MDKKKISKEERQIGARVRAVRKANNLTQEQMAEKLGISSTPHYQNIENGRNNIGYKHLKCLKTEFGVSSDFILFGDVKDENEFVFNIESLPPEQQIDILMRIIAYMCEKDGRIYGETIHDKLVQKKKED